MALLFESAASIVTSVLGEYLEWKDISTLDRACCSVALREEVKRALSADGLVFQAFRCVDGNGLSWLQSRGCRCKNLCVELKDLDTDLGEYMEGMGSIFKILSVKEKEGNLDVFPWFGLYKELVTNCSDLEELRLHQISVDTSINTVFFGCPNLKHLTLKPANGRSNDILWSISTYCNTIKSLNLQAGDFTEKFHGLLSKLDSLHAFDSAWNMTFEQPIQLQELTLGKVGNEEILPLARQCPDLRYLAAITSSLDEATTKTIPYHFPLLHTLILGEESEEDEDNEAVLLELITKLPSLCHLSYRYPTTAAELADYQEERDRTARIQHAQTAFAAQSATPTAPPPAVETGKPRSKSCRNRNDPAPLLVSPLRTLAVNSLTLTTLQRLLSTCPQLTSLSVKYLFDDDEDDINEGFSALVDHGIRSFTWLECTSWAIEYLPRFHRLESLCLKLDDADDDNDDEVDHQMLWFAERNRTLTSLTLHNFGASIFGLTRWAMHFPLLQELDVVVGGNHFGGHYDTVPKMMVLQALRGMCPKLRKLKIEW